MGYYLPEYMAAAAFPSAEECLQEYTRIVDACATSSRYNVGAINVKRLPDIRGDGEAVVEEEMRWLIASEKLTL